MDIQLGFVPTGRKLHIWKDFLAKVGLEADENVERTVLVWDNEQLIATGSRQENILKCIAVDESRQGEGLTATVLTQLRQDAFAAGHRHLFLYTKPKNSFMFSSLFFYPVAQTNDVLLMEDRARGIQGFLDTLPVPCKEGRIGAAVMNCNPFTLGHQYLIETASKECDHVYVFILSEDKSQFSAHDRMELVKQGTSHLSNVTILPTGPYLISSATFPTYFLKDREQAQTVQCLLDIEIFLKYYVPKFGITCRYVGTEPLSQMTDQYNQALLANLPARGIELRLIPRLETEAAPISATTVRQALETEDWETLKRLVPPTTLEFLRRN